MKLPAIDVTNFIHKKLTPLHKEDRLADKIHWFVWNDRW